MNLMMYCDSGYVKNILITLESFFAFHNSLCIKFFVLGRGWSEKEIKDVEKYLLLKNSSLIYLDVAKNLNSIPYNNTVVSIFFSWIFAPRLIDEDKVLCIDNDIMFNASIEDLYNDELTNECVSGVLDWNNELSKIAVGLNLTDLYINSGFKILNLKKLREIEFEKKALSFISEYSIETYSNQIRDFLNNSKEFWKLMYGNIGYVYFHDQGVLAKLLCGQIKLIAPKYNVTRYVLDESVNTIVGQWGDFYTEEQVLEAKYHPAIIHFAGGAKNKPWNSECDHPYCDLYRYYADKIGIDIDLECTKKKYRKQDLLKMLPDFCSSLIYKWLYFRNSKGVYFKEKR